MSNVVNYHILNSTIVLSYSGKTTKVDKDSDVGKKVISLIKEDKLNEIPNIVDNSLRLKKISQDKFAVIDGAIYSYGERVHKIIESKIIQFMEEELPFDNLINFWNNLKQNPSKASQDELYLFLEANEFPLTPDGHFIAYKKVSKDFKDLYTHSIDNSVGARPKMNRDDVDPNRNVDCSVGLHIASFHYAKNIYESRNNTAVLVEVKVNPRDVVSVPYDYNNQKARCCEYEVVGVITEPHQTLVVEGEKYAPVDDDFYDDGYGYDSAYFDADDEIKPDDQSFITVKIGNIEYIAMDGFNNKEEFLKATQDGYRKRKPSDIPKTLRCLDNQKVYQLYSKNDNGKIRYLGWYGDDSGYECFMIIE